MTTPRSIYTVAMHQIVEQRNEWSWVTIKIIDKQPRPQVDEERTTVARG